MPLRLAKTLEPFWYTLDGYEDDEKPPKFFLKPLEDVELDRALEGSEVKNDSLLLTARGVDAALRSGVKDWDNVEFDDGDVRFKRNLIGKLSYLTRRLIAREIINSSRVTETERKN